MGDSGARVMWRRLHRADVVLIVAVCLFAAPYVGLGKYSLIAFHDNADQVMGALSVISPGELWLRYSTAGFDRFAIGIASWFNVMLFHAVPAWLAAQLLVVFQVVCGTVGIYVLCRRVFGVDRWAALVPALLHGATIDGRLVYSVVAAQPMLVVVAAWLADSPRSLWRWLGAMAFTFIFSQSGYISFVVPWPAATVVGWFLFVDVRRKPAEWIAILSVAIALVGFRWHELQALALQAPASQIAMLRGLPSADTALVWPQIVDGYLPMALSALMVLGVVTLGRRSRPALGALAFVVVGILGTVAIAFVQVQLSKVLPFVRGYNFSRIYFAYLPAWLAGAGLGAQYLLNLTRQVGPHVGFRRKLGYGGLGLTMALGLSVALTHNAAMLKDWISEGNYVQIFQSPVIRDLVPLTREGPWPQRVEAFQLHSSTLLAYGLETTGGYHPLFSRRYYEFWSTILDPWLASVADVPDALAWWRIPARLKEDGGWPVYRSDRLLLSVQDHLPERQLNDLYHLNLLSLANVGWFLSRDRLLDADLQLVSGPQQPWSALTTREKIVTSLKANFTGRTHLFVYRNPNAFPRFFSPTRIEVRDDGRATLAAMAESDLEALRTTVFAAKADLPAELVPGRTYPLVAVKPVSYASDEIRIEVEAPQGGLLMGMNSYSPFWTLEIDGQPGRIFPADHTFWGMVVPPGARWLTFRYRPPYG